MARVAPVRPKQVNQPDRRVRSFSLPQSRLGCGGLSPTLATMRLPHLFCLLFIMSGLAHAQTLCRKGETDYFSCSVSLSGKIISVCGNISSDELTDDDWVQYRFGKPRAIELQFPQEKLGSALKFEGNNFWRHNFIDLRFINGRALYSVALYGPYSSDAFDGERKGYKGEVSVTLAGSPKPVIIPCRKVAGPKYFGIFKELNNVLPGRDPDSGMDMLEKFDAITK